MNKDCTGTQSSDLKQEAVKKLELPPSFLKQIERGDELIEEVIRRVIELD